MSIRLKLSAVAMLLGITGACSFGRHSSAAFRLPPDGDPERGRAAFVALGCNECHQVSGVELPRPTVQPPVPVLLGGPVPSKLSDSYLVTSVIYPAHDIGPYAPAQVTRDGKSRMPHRFDQMTVRELTDVVAFLQSRYSVAEPLAIR
jgi:sulfur-oxidizing protein SoxX